ncbi:MAG: HAD family hydrolase [Bacillus sp. (in: Bacteria)]|nr:HAD family hydrolase [Bacillus sp. (in: firmicutes)]MCM1427924.1 HAD family hydrolase [Eubacterium sp.]
MNIKLYQDYIFDLYGTLVDIRTDEKQQALWDKMSLFYGYYGAAYKAGELHALYLSLVSAKEKEKRSIYAEQPHYEHESYPEIPIEEVFRELYEKKGVRPTKELVLHTGQMFRVFSTHHIRLYAGAKELLQKLKEKKRGVYLLSNAQRIFTEYELRYLRIYDCFDGILISSDYGVKKPDERFFRLLTEKYQIEPEKALMIGNDLDCDIAGAKKLGMDTFYIHSAISPALKRTVDADYAMMRMNLAGLKKQLLPDR